jgi:hypothetical protein
MQARPSLKEQMPKNVLNIISDSFTDTIDLRERDPESFKDRPLGFFT